MIELDPVVTPMKYMAASGIAVGWRAMKARGRTVDAVGWLRPSRPTDDLAARLESDGYLFVPGLLDREAVHAARLELLGVAAAHDALDPAHPLEDGCCGRTRRRSGSRRKYPASSDAVHGGAAGRRRCSSFFAGRPRRRDPQLRLHVAAREAARPRRRAALRSRLHGPRDAGRADLLDAVRRHRARGRGADAARGLAPQVAPASRRLPAPGRRQLLRQRAQRGRGALRRDEVGALGRGRRPARTGAARSPTTPSPSGSSGAGAG